MSIDLSVVVPVYRNHDTIPDLCARLEELMATVDAPIEAVFVIDGSPDSSLELIEAWAEHAPFPTQIITHSRNFGSFAAIRTGMRHAVGRIIGVMAADLQEPPELMAEFHRVLSTGSFDVAVGRRTRRHDGIRSRFASGAFWSIYRRLVIRDLPPGGVDIFACTAQVSQEIVGLQESNTSLVGLLYWVGFRRAEVPYERLSRPTGTSGWTFRGKLRYLSDSIFAFTDLPLTALVVGGTVGASLTMIAAIAVFISYLMGAITEPGYTPLMLVVLFSTFSILLALGIVGGYVWRAFENTKRRPDAIVLDARTFPRD